jgi:hypothetical protein
MTNECVIKREEQPAPSFPQPAIEDIAPAPPIPERDEEHLQESSAGNISEEDSASNSEREKEKEKDSSSEREKEKERDSPPSPTPAVVVPIARALFELCLMLFTETAAVVSSAIVYAAHSHNQQLRPLRLSAAFAQDRFALALPPRRCCATLVCLTGSSFRAFTDRKGALASAFGATYW